MMASVGPRTRSLVTEPPEVVALFSGHPAISEEEEMQRG